MAETGSIVGPLPEPIESIDKYAPLLEKIRAMMNEAIAEASEEYRYENPSEIYEIINQYFKQNVNVGAKSYFSNIVKPLFDSINVRQARTRSAAGSSQTIQVNLFDNLGNEITTGAGSNITVYCNTGGDNLDVSVPLLTNDQDFMVVYKAGTGKWWCIDSFNVGQTAKAWVQITPGAVTSVSCWFSETDGSGQTISVPINIIGGGNLNAAVPRLVDGNPIVATKYRKASGGIGTVWACPSLFMGSKACACS